MLELTEEILRHLFRCMLRVRLFEESLCDLLESGEVKCPCHLYIGQEAIACGVCAALHDDDVIWGTHRSHGHYLAKGADMKKMMAEILVRVDGCSKGRGGSMHLFAGEKGILGTVPIVAATIPIATGAALASKLRGDGRVSVSFFGDGATEEGHFHESVNLAALNKLPVVFVCENNLYASHMYILQRRRKDNIEEVAQLYGINGYNVDGNDAEAVYRAAGEAFDRCRGGEGPALLVCRTYRWRGHVGPKMDLDVGENRREELKKWMAKDPIARARQALAARGVTEAQMDEIEQEVREEVSEAIEFARNSPYPKETELMDHVYSCDKVDH